MPQETSQAALEQTFSDLANARLRDKSPVLLDYLVGFQLIDNDEDGSRAVGMFAFEIGGDWHYSPVFFLNGEVKGLDSLYSVNSDLFVPLNEDWVNSIINRRPTVLGESDKRNRKQRGVRTPDYNRLRTLPSGIYDGGGGGFGLSKSASEQPPVPIHKLMNMRKAANTVDLPGAVSAMGHDFAKKFASALHDSTNPHHIKLANAVLRHYSPVDFSVPEKVEMKVAAESDPITIISSVGQEGSDDLTDAQRQQILEGDVAVVDKRPEMTKSVVYSTETKQQLTNPTGAGLYDCLMSSGKIEQCLIWPVYGEDGLVFVMRVSDESVGITAPGVIFTTRCYTATDMKDALEKVSKSADSIRPYDKFVLACGSGATKPMLAVAKDTEGDVTTIKKGHCGCYELKSVPDGFMHNRRGEVYPPRPLGYIGDHDCEAVVITPGGNKHIKCTRGCAFVNSNEYRAIVFDRKTPSEDSSPIWDPATEFEGKLKYSDFGDHNTIVEVMEKVASPVKVWSTDTEVVVKDDFGTKGMGKVAALGYLMRKHAVSEADARTMVKTAMRRPRRWLVKAAASDDLMAFPDLNDTSEGGVMSSYHTTQSPYETEVKAPSPSNREFYQYFSPFGQGGEEGEPDAFSAIQRASETGQKEVFDAAVLGSMVKSHAPTDMVERFLPTIVAGMDRLGRILFLLHWHYDEFQERYGKEELIEFVDNLRSTFEALGDLVIFMRRRTLSGDPEFYGLGLNAAMDG